MGSDFIVPATKPAPRPAPPTKLALVATPVGGAQTASERGNATIDWLLSLAQTRSGDYFNN